MKFIFPTLLEYSPETTKLSPVLVKSRPEIEPINDGPYSGGAKYSYELLDEATWDNGSPLTAKDYEFTLKVLFNPHVACEVYRQYLSLIRDVELDSNNPKKFAVLTDEQYIKAEYATGLFILPEYVYDPEGLLKNYSVGDLTDPAQAEKHAADENLKAFGEQFNSSKYSREKEFVSGAGAYKLEEWIAGERIVLKKKENWWGDKLRDQNKMLSAYPEKLIYIPVSDPATSISMLKDQSIDVMSAIPENQFLELKENELVNQHYNFYTPDILGYYFLYLNTRIPKLEDKRVRRALAHLFDVDEVLKSVKLGFAVPIIGPFHSTRSYYNKNLEPIKLNIEKARNLLSEAGWTDSNGNGTVDKNIDGELVEMNLQYLITPNNPTSNNFRRGAARHG
jgi:peptide/nickel transport system substrate-binding protein